MRKRNTILALVAAGLLTVVAFTPALPEGLQCSDYPNLDRCPLYGGYAKSHAARIALSTGTQTHQA